MTQVAAPVAEVRTERDDRHVPVARVVARSRARTRRIRTDTVSSVSGIGGRNFVIVTSTASTPANDSDVSADPIGEAFEQHILRLANRHRRRGSATSP